VGSGALRDRACKPRQKQGEHKARTTGERPERAFIGRKSELIVAIEFFNGQLARICLFEKSVAGVECHDAARKGCVAPTL
jgi:hypothetical protein